MTPDELRALADALPEGVHWSDPITPDMLAEAIRRFCADAQPMAMLESHRRLVEQAIQNTEHPSGMSTHDGKARIDASILRRMLSIIDSSPAVPAGWKLVPVEPTQAMNNAGLSAVNQYGKRSVWETYAAMLAAAPAAPQAEPKRTGEVK